MEMSYIIFSLLIINLIIFQFNKSIAKNLNLFDKPDYKRKIHLVLVPLTGGIFLYFNFIVILFLLNLDFFNYLNLNINNKREFLSIFFLVSSLFLLGLYDDRYDISPQTKLFLLSFIVLVGILIDENLIIKDLTFAYFNYSFDLSKLSIPLTILFILLFINALNMFDGIDMQVSTYFLIIILFLFFNYEIKFLFYFIPVILFILYLNFKKKLFLGDSGTNIIAILISWVIIKDYNLNNKFFCEEVFVMMSIPGLDMLRLFCIRLMKGQNPFSADKNHLHHLFLKKFKFFLSFLIIQFLILIPITFYLVVGSSIASAIIAIIVYSLSLVFLKLK